MGETSPPYVELGMRRFEEIKKRQALVRGLSWARKRLSLGGIRSVLQKWSQFCRRLELWNRIKFLERRGKSVRQTPSGRSRELLILRIEIKVIHPTPQLVPSFPFP